ncbi:type I-E CRISPR-associated protein Cas6/Cse3/CasE [Alterinioella nitratireducens]|uniref:type I-E CRISPR-associated protein Cas6/Cse3/CasE n=1 Tax=Alterinioella nitratireducens TaxID=2735915 RepID=UPI004059570B
MYLSRFRLSRSPQVAALDALLDPAEEGRKHDAHHRLIWTAFADDPDAKRDFLWRKEGNGSFLVQSMRRPETSPFFDSFDIREHAPDLRAGDRLGFLLRANATRDLRGERRRRVDVVMNLLHDVPKDQRATTRMDLAQEAAADWLAGQGMRAGFSVDRVEAQDYRTVSLPRQRRGGAPHFGILDLTGLITVTEPDAFTHQLAQGFGRAKGFGCGLMLIRRA